MAQIDKLSDTVKRVEHVIQIRARAEQEHEAEIKLHLLPSIRCRSLRSSDGNLLVVPRSRLKTKRD